MISSRASRRTQLAATLVVVLAGCSSYTPPAARAPVDKETRIGAPVESVWKAVIRYFGDLNMPIENLDHSSFFIKTRPVDLATSFRGLSFKESSAPISTSSCDCGSGSMANVWSSTTRVHVSFNVILEPEGDAATRARVNAFFAGVKLGKRRLDTSGYDTEMRLTCVSTGNFERDLARFLERSASAR